MAFVTKAGATGAALLALALPLVATGCGQLAAAPSEAAARSGFAIAQQPERPRADVSGRFFRMDPPEIRWRDSTQPEWQLDAMAGKATRRGTVGAGRSYTITYHWTPPPAGIPDGGLVFTYGGTVEAEDSTDRFVMMIDVRFDGVLTNPEVPPTAEAWTNRPGWAASAAQSVGVTPRQDLQSGTKGYYRVIIQGGPVIEYRYTY